MATTVRAYGLRGLAIALGTTALAAVIHGVLTASTSVLLLEIFFALVVAMALAMAGATSARASRAGAVLTGIAMALLFVWLRWSVWSAMLPEVESLALTGLWAWPAAMDALIARGALTGHLLWIMEGSTMLAAALTGCLLGWEPRT